MARRPSRPPFRFLGALLAAVLAVLASRPALAQGFREASREAGIDHVALDPHRIAGGLAFFDYDGDGDPDLWLSGGRNPDRLYRNRGDGTFEDVTGPAGLGFLADVPTVGVVTGDIDNDGCRDVFVTTFEGHPNVLLRNECDGTFTDVTEAAGVGGDAVWSTAASFGDYDLDGWLDLYVGNYATYDALPYDENLTGGIPNYLYRNRGDGTFEEVARQLGVEDPDGLALAVAFTDYDGDADVDIWVANDFGYLFQPNKLYRNDGEAGFVEVGGELDVDDEINGMGIAAGDFDEDGDLDYYITNMSRNRLHENLQRGRGSSGARAGFVDVAREKGVDDEYATSWGAAFADIDLDGHLDLLLANGRVLPRYNMEYLDHLQRLVQPHENRLWRGDGAGNLVDVGRKEGIADSTRGRGLAWADIDGDGDLDLAISVVVPEPAPGHHALLYRNEGRDGNWLAVKLEGSISNRDAFGSRVHVVAEGRRQIREIDGGSSYLSQSETVAHFGLGAAAVADSVMVVWPGGHTEVLTDVPANRTIRVVEGQLAEGPLPPEGEDRPPREWGRPVPGEDRP